MNDRLNWYIRPRGGSWLATYIPTGETLVARSRPALMSKINRARREEVAHG